MGEQERSEPATIRVALHGAAGRMGRAITEALAGAEGMALGVAFDRASDAAPGTQPLSAEALAGIDVAIDFTTPAAVPAIAEACRIARVPLVSGTTGLDDTAVRALESLSDAVAVLHAPNTSLGVNVLFHLAEEAARRLSAFDLEVVEMHHRRKIDAPSGTAVRLAERVARARDLEPAEVVVHGRSGQIGPRRDDEIGVMTLRGGTVVGEHTLILAGAFERLELTHRAEDRALFAHGAVTAARFLAGRAPGRYGMDDVLGLR